MSTPPTFIGYGTLYLYWQILMGADLGRHLKPYFKDGLISLQLIGLLHVA